MRKISNRAWRKNALFAVKRTATKFKFFTSDDVWAAMRTRPEEPRVMGHVFQDAREIGYCEPHIRTLPSKRKACHARPLTIWRSLIFRPSP